MTSLWQLSNDYQKLLYKDELTAEDMETLDHLHGFIEDKVVNCACLINEIKSKLHQTDEAIKVAQEKRARIKANIERLEKYTLDALINNKIEKVDKHPLFDVKVKHNPVSVQDYEPGNIPKEYWVENVTYSLDKKKIKDDIQNGKDVPGAKLINKIVLKIE